MLRPHHGQGSGRTQRVGGLRYPYRRVDPVERRRRHDRVVRPVRQRPVLEPGRHHVHIRVPGEIAAGDRGHPRPRLDSGDPAAPPGRRHRHLAGAAAHLQYTAAGDRARELRQVVVQPGSAGPARSYSSASSSDVRLGRARRYSSGLSSHRVRVGGAGHEQQVGDTRSRSRRRCAKRRLGGTRGPTLPRRHCASHRIRTSSRALPGNQQRWKAQLVTTATSTDRPKRV